MLTADPTLDALMVTNGLLAVGIPVLANLVLAAMAMLLTRDPNRFWLVGAGLVGALQAVAVSAGAVGVSAFAARQGVDQMLYWTQGYRLCAATSQVVWWTLLLVGLARLLRRPSPAGAD